MTSSPSSMRAPEPDVYPTGRYVPSLAHRSGILQIQEHESSKLQRFVVVFTTYYFLRI